MSECCLVFTPGIVHSIPCIYSTSILVFEHSWNLTIINVLSHKWLLLSLPARKVGRACEITQPLLSFASAKESSKPARTPAWTNHSGRYRSVRAGKAQPILMHNISFLKHFLCQNRRWVAELLRTLCIEWQARRYDSSILYTRCRSGYQNNYARCLCGWVA